MLFTALIAVCALTGVLLLAAALRRFRRHRVLGGALCGTSALALLLLAACIALLGANLRTYQRLTFEQPAGELQLTRVADREYNAVLTYPGGEHANYLLRGDEWVVDARVLKWHSLANLVGFDAAYRLDRIGGRYARVEDERTRPRTVYSLNPPQRIDPWDLVHDHHSWVPWVDALYGSATYLPMADGALFEIKVSQSGLVARPLNQAARDALAGWH